MKLAEAYVEIRADMKPFMASLGRARRTVERLGKRMGRAFGRVFSGAARRALRMAKWGIIGLIGATTAAVYSFAEFEKQLNMIATMLDDQTMRLLPGFGRALQKMAAQYGESTKTLSKGLYDILSASIPAEKAISVLDVAVRAARAGMTDAAISTDALTTLLNAYGLEANQATRVADILFATVKRGKLTFADLAQNVGMVASTAKMANVSMEELGAMLALMTRAGISSSEAATALNAILIAFLKPADDAVRQAAEFGLVLSSNTIRTKGLHGAMKLVQNATAEEIVTMFPRIRGMKGVAAAIQNLDELTKDLAFTQKAGGRMMEAYEKTAKGTAFLLARLRQQVIQTGRSLGRILAPHVNIIVERMREWIEANEELIAQKFGEWVENVEKVVKATREWVEANRELITQKFGEWVDKTKAVMAMIPEWWERSGKDAFQAVTSALMTAIDTIRDAYRALELITGKPLTPWEKRAAPETKRAAALEEEREWREEQLETATGRMRELVMQRLAEIAREQRNMRAAARAGVERRKAEEARRGRYPTLLGPTGKEVTADELAEARRFQKIKQYFPILRGPEGQDITQLPQVALKKTNELLREIAKNTKPKPVGGVSPQNKPSAYYEK